MPKIQNNTATPPMFKRNPLLRNIAAGVLGLTTATTGYLATDYVSEGNEAKTHREEAVDLLAKAAREDRKALEDNMQSTLGKNGIELKVITLENNLDHNKLLRERDVKIKELSSSISQDQGFNYLAAVVGLASGLISALVAGKKLKAEQVVGNFKELCHALVQSSKDGEFSTPEASYKIDFKDLFTNTMQELINDPISQNKDVRLAFLEHKKFFMQMFKNLAYQGRIDDAKLIINNMPRLGISKADILDVIAHLSPGADLPKGTPIIPWPKRRDFIASISGLLETLDDNGYRKHPGIERLREQGFQIEETL